MAKTTETVPAVTDPEKLVEVRLLRNYVPADPEVLPGDPAEPVFKKILAGEVISLPRSEARQAIANGIAAVTADLI
jgi:hypothetical protein